MGDWGDEMTSKQADDPDLPRNHPKTDEDARVNIRYILCSPRFHDAHSLNNPVGRRFACAFDALASVFLEIVGRRLKCLYKPPVHTPNPRLTHVYAHTVPSPPPCVLAAAKSRWPWASSRRHASTSADYG